MKISDYLNILKLESENQGLCIVNAMYKNQSIYSRRFYINGKLDYTKYGYK